MKERCRDGCRTSLLIAGVVLVPAIFHTSLPPCHPYITIHFMEMIISTCTEWFHSIDHASYEGLVRLLIQTKANLDIQDREVSVHFSGRLITIIRLINC